MRPQLMSVMCSRPSMPSRSTNAPKSVMFLTMPLRMSAGLDLRKQSRPLAPALLLDQLAAREDDVPALVVDLEDLEFVGLADVPEQVLRAESRRSASRAGRPRRRRRRSGRP